MSKVIYQICCHVDRAAIPRIVFCGFCTIGSCVLVYFSDFTYPYSLRQGFRVDICVLFIYLAPKNAAPWQTILY